MLNRGPEIEGADIQIYWGSEIRRDPGSQKT